MSSAYATQERRASAEAPAQIQRLTAPVGGMPVDGSAVAFSWMETPGALDYRVEIAADADFQQVVCALQTGPTTLFTLLEMLPQDGSVFYWRVQALTASGWQPWSAAESFKARTDQHEIAFRTKQRAITGPDAPPKATAPAGPAAEATSVTPPYQVSHTDKGTIAFFLALMIATFAATFIYIAYVVTTAQ